MEKLCIKCPNKERGCQHEPQTFDGRIIPARAAATSNICIHKCCVGAILSGIHNKNKIKNPLIREIEGKQEETYPIATEEKPTVKDPEILPLYGQGGRRRTVIAGSRKRRIQEAKRRSDDSFQFALNRERVFTKNGDIYSTDSNGKLKYTGDNIFRRSGAKGIVIEKNK